MPFEPYIGELAIFAGDFPPRNWALCNGQLLNIGEYTALYTVIGPIYGGDGKTTFALPDLRGRVLVQCTNGAVTPISPSTLPGAKGGAEVFDIPPRALPQHTHTATFSGGKITPLSLEIAVSKNAGNKPDADGNLFSTYRTTPSATPGNLYIYPPDAGSKGTLGGVKASSISPTGKVKIDPAGQQSVSSTPLDIMQPWLALNYIIATRGLYPSRH